MAENRATTNELPALAKFRNTDMGNAQRFASVYDGRVKHVPERNMWLVWDGTRWKADNLGTIIQLAKHLIRTMYVQAGVATEPSYIPSLSEWATKCESRAKLESMLALARPEPEIAISPGKLDTSAWLINCLNGTFNLKTMELQAHSPDDLITKRVNVDYSPDAKAPVWLKFLNRIFDGDKELIAYVQRAVGYTLTGVIAEHALFFLLGGGRNGKSTFIETIVDLLQEYSVRLRTESLITKDGSGGIPNDIAALAGMRVCVTDETEQDQRMAESLVKKLTGGDEIRARFLHQEFFTFKPAHKLWMFGNHKLNVRGTDKGIWERIKLIPFNVTIPESERDPYLKDKLRAELSGILTWAIDGCFNWQFEGLGTCDAVERATSEYRIEMDSIGDWLNTSYALDPNGRVSLADLYSSYKNYMDENGERTISRKRLSVLLKERNFRADRSTGGYTYFYGLKSLTAKLNLADL